MPDATLEFELPEDLGDARVVGRLGEHLRVEQARTGTLDRVLLDTFDRRPRAKGLRCEWPGRRSPTRRMILYEPGAPVRRAHVADGPSVGMTALPAGPLRDRLAPVLHERSLLPVVRVCSRTTPLSVLNEDDKTVVRLAIERPVLLGGPRAVPLAARAGRRAAAGLRGGVRPHGRLRAARPRSRPVRHVAVRRGRDRSGRPARGVSSKVRVGLAPGTRADVAAGIVLGRLLGGAEANVPGTLEDLDTEFLHDLRVSIRRARSVLREFAGVHPEAPRARLRAELRWAQALTGPVRDLDVWLLEWDALTRLLAAEPAGDLEPLRRLLLQRRAQELALSGAVCAAAASLRCWTPGGRSPRPPPATRGRTRRRGRRSRSRSWPATGSGGCTRALCATAARSTTTARTRRCTNCASAARSCATCSSSSATCSRTVSSRRW
jgi:hypothetical protein